jgi:hypothetical protein
LKAAVAQDEDVIAIEGDRAAANELRKALRQS